MKGARVRVPASALGLSRVAGAIPDQTWSGMAGLADAARFTIQTFENWSIRADEYREIDSERVPVLVKYSGRGKASGLEVAEIREGGANLFHIRDGTLTSPDRAGSRLM